MVVTVGQEQQASRRIGKRWGRHIKATREARGMSRVQLAIAIGCHPDAVAKWERGDVLPRPVMQLAIAKALDSPWLSLFSLEGETL